MKKLLLIFTSLFMTLSLFSQNEYRVVAKSHNVYKSPSTKSNIIGSLNRGDNVTIKSSNKEWSNIQFENQSCWILNGSLVPAESKLTNYEKYRHKKGDIYSLPLVELMRDNVKESSIYSYWQSLQIPCLWLIIAFFVSTIIIIISLWGSHIDRGVSMGAFMLATFMVIAQFITIFICTIEWDRFINIIISNGEFHGWANLFIHLAVYVAAIYLCIISYMRYNHAICDFVPRFKNGSIPLIIGLASQFLFVFLCVIVNLFGGMNFGWIGWIYVACQLFAASTILYNIRSIQGVFVALAFLFSSLSALLLIGSSAFIVVQIVIAIIVALFILNIFLGGRTLVLIVDKWGYVVDYFFK